jgi:hypothetical protein
VGQLESFNIRPTAEILGMDRIFVALAVTSCLCLASLSAAAQEKPTYLLKKKQTDKK